MNFNSVVFLFCFMPLALGLYYLVPGRVKNAVLLVESLLFFCWGGITWLPLAVGMVAINYAAGLLLASLPAGQAKNRADCCHCADGSGAGLLQIHELFAGHAQRYRFHRVCQAEFFGCFATGHQLLYV